MMQVRNLKKNIIENCYYLSYKIIAFEFIRELFVNIPFNLKYLLRSVKILLFLLKF